MEEVVDRDVAGQTQEEPLSARDQASKQLLRDEQAPKPIVPGQPVREDYHSKRQGVQALFLFFDPIRG